MLPPDVQAQDIESVLLLHPRAPSFRRPPSRRPGALRGMAANPVLCRVDVPE